ncbi:MAG: hypothetical protein ABIQ04_04930 [Candidatus Saccharimonadales bacterium]
MNDGTQKQQIVEKIKSSSNILVTVSANPSVDELSAALGLTILLNNMSKHATAVFSGSIPPAITFLDPEKTFESTVDSLRDFIIALDKEKADHLRYKVEGDVVKIFITPYRTTITGDDLDFSQGDYNVELVLALGVKDKDNLDEALSAHGRILHDATVVTMSAGDNTSSLGTIDWHESNASSLSEMVVGLTDSLKKDKSLLDEQTATAFLTGIVSATDRFSNPRTSSKVMTVAAQLMAAGANQQLIASKLEEAHDIGQNADNNKDTGSGSGTSNSDGTTDLSEGEPTKLNKNDRNKNKKIVDNQTPVKKNDGSLSISHEKEGDIDSVASETAEENQADALDVVEEKLEEDRKEVAEKQQTEAAKQAEDMLAKQLNATAQVAVPAAATLSVADLQKDLAQASAQVDHAASQNPSTAQIPDQETEPSFGGTLNATAEDAAETKRREINDDRNRTILSHSNGDYVGANAPTYQSPLNAASAPAEEPVSVDPFHDNDTPLSGATSYSPPIQPPVSMAAPPAPIDLFATPVASPEQTSAPTLADIDQQNRSPHEEARDAVAAAFGESPQSEPFAIPAPSEAVVTSESLPSAMSLPPLPDFSTLPPLPPVPDFGMPSTPPSSDKLGDIFGATPPVSPSEPVVNNPGQFKIPGQS